MTPPRAITTRASHVMTALATEGGQTVVLVLALLVIALGLAAAGVAETLSSSQLTNADARARRAQQAADAGIQAQLYQQSEADLGSTAYNLNGGLIGTGTFLDCFIPKLNVSLQVTGIVGVAANNSGVCPQAQSSTGTSTTNVASLGNHTSYQSEMVTGQNNFLNGTTIGSQNGGAMRELFPKIVSIGSETSSDPGDSGTVYSREEAILAPIEPLQMLEGENNVTICGLTLLGTCVASVLNGDVMARNKITTPAITVGTNLTLTNGLLATLTAPSFSAGLTIANEQIVPASQIIQRQPITISATKADCPTAGCPTGYTGITGTSAHNFSMTSGTVTIQPGDYVFCNFSATGGTLNVSPSSSTPVRIFIDSPTSTRCAGDSSPKGNFTDTVGFSNGLLGTGGILASSGVQIYVAGDGSYDDNTTVQIGPTSTSGLLSLSALTYGAVIYAPTSKVTVNVPALCVLTCSLLSSGGVFEGAIIGNDVSITALTITQDLDLGNYPLYSGVNAFRPVQYVQCDNTVKALTQSTSDLNGC
jgi:hypothetical protein